MEPIAPLIRQYHLTTFWYSSVLEDIAEADGGKTIKENTNSLEWIAGHLIVGRYRNILRIGQKIEPYKFLDLFINQAAPPPNAIAFNANNKYPSLAESRKQWVSYSDIFLNGLKNITPEILATELPFAVPIGGKTVNDALTFTSMHETFHIGQMSIMRKVLGYPAMKLNPQAR